ncbi:MAG: glycoside hydrolase family 28 protein [Clostridiales bacterium]|nr:glycoside hydrolase family 28 protein [Clostridiales bacterium]
MEYKMLMITPRCVTFEIMDKEADYHTKQYDIYVNGQRIFCSDKTIESIYDLKPDTDYAICLIRGEEQSSVEFVHTPQETVVLNVKAYGAAGDGGKNDTAALQAAILSCPPGGRVIVPAGIYCFTHLFLKSNLTLELREGAVLSGIPDRELFPVLPGNGTEEEGEQGFCPGLWEGKGRDSYASLLTGISVENVVICGRGIIDGNAAFDNWWNLEQFKEGPARPRMLYLYLCKNITVEGVTFRNSPSWNLHPCYSRQIRFLNVKILSSDHSPNTDGIDPESCVNVEIAGVYFSVGDDCIAIKSSKTGEGGRKLSPSENIEIHHCLMEKGHGGVTIGSETTSGVKNISVRNCFLLNTDRGLRVKTRRGRGRDSYVTDILFERVRMDGVRTPFVINCFYYCGEEGKTEYVRTKECLPADERTPRVGVIRIRHVECLNCHVAALYFYGLPESKIESVDMYDVHITYAKDAEPGIAAMMADCKKCARKGVFVRNASRVSLKDVTIEGNEGETVDLDEVDNWSWTVNSD